MGTLKLGTTKWSLRLSTHNSAGLRIEAEETWQMILQGALESPSETHDKSMRTARVQDKRRKLLGVRLPRMIWNINFMTAHLNFQSRNNLMTPTVKIFLSSSSHTRNGNKKVISYNFLEIMFYLTLSERFCFEVFVFLLQTNFNAGLQCEIMKKKSED